MAYGGGVALALAGFPATRPSLLLLPLLILPFWPWHRPVAVPLVLLFPVLGAGVWIGGAAASERAADCRLSLPIDGWEGVVAGRFETRVTEGRSFPFRVEAGLPNECVQTVMARWPTGFEPPATGTWIEGWARWEGRHFPDPKRPLRAGMLRFTEAPEGEITTGAHTPEQGMGPWTLGIRGRIQDRIASLWGGQAPMVEALVLARREHLDPSLREAFGISGTAHLLAISGFHVGVVAGLVLGLLRLLRLPPRRATLGAAMVSWIYVLGIGAPDAALRAACLLSLLALARLRGVPVVPVGALSTAFLLLLVLDPLALGSIGFQLSFAGTLGLVLLRAPLLAQQEALWVRLGGRPFSRGKADGDPVRLWLRGSSEGLAAGIAATLPTLPLLAWHFDRVSIIGIFATLVVAPGVSLAIPGIASTLLLSTFAPGLAPLLAGGVGWILEGVALGVRGAASFPGAAPWVSRPTLVAGVGGAAVFWILVSRFRPPGLRGVRRPVRSGLALLVGASLVMVLPIIPLNRSLELHILDVGQGEAIAVRFPHGRWMLVDAGPASPGWDAGARTVLPYLRRQGVRSLEALVITHAHLDHLGGAAAVLRGLPVRGVLEPGRVTPSVAYLEALQAGASAKLPWWPALAGTHLDVPDVEVRILYPGPPRPEDPPAGPSGDPNQVSIVLHLQWGAASVLLTGDAYSRVEQEILGELAHVTVLKLGHHGSRTSTSEALLARTQPQLAVASLADGNTYGHPHREVLERLQRARVPLLRTDRDGHIRIRLTQTGEWRVDGIRP